MTGSCFIVVFPFLIKNQCKYFTLHLFIISTTHLIKPFLDFRPQRIRTGQGLVFASKNTKIIAWNCKNNFKLTSSPNIISSCLTVHTVLTFFLQKRFFFAGRFTCLRTHTAPGPPVATQPFLKYVCYQQIKFIMRSWATTPRFPDCSYNSSERHFDCCCKALVSLTH